MRYGKVQMRGKFINQLVTTAPAYASADKGRMVYAQDDDQIHFGCDSSAAMINLFDAAHNLIPWIGSIYTIGEIGSTFLEIHSDEFIGAVTGDLTGDVRSSNNGVCLNNGPTPSAATFTGTSTKAKYA